MREGGMCFRETHPAFFLSKNINNHTSISGVYSKEMTRILTAWVFAI